MRIRKNNVITVMEKLKDIEKKRNYRVTIIFNDEIVIETFETQEGAMKTVNNFRDLFPKTFVGGAVEKKQKQWKVIWTASSKKS